MRPGRAVPALLRHDRGPRVHLCRQGRYGGGVAHPGPDLRRGLRSFRPRLCAVHGACRMDGGSLGRPALPRRDRRAMVGLHPRNRAGRNGRDAHRGAVPVRRLRGGSLSHRRPCHSYLASPRATRPRAWAFEHGLAAGRSRGALARFRRHCDDRLACFLRRPGRCRTLLGCLVVVVVS